MKASSSLKQVPGSACGTIRRQNHRFTQLHWSAGSKKSEQLCSGAFSNFRIHWIFQKIKLFHSFRAASYRDEPMTSKRSNYLKILLSGKFRRSLLFLASLLPWLFCFILSCFFPFAEVKYFGQYAEEITPSGTGSETLRQVVAIRAGDSSRIASPLNEKFR